MNKFARHIIFPAALIAALTASAFAGSATADPVIDAVAITNFSCPAGPDLALSFKPTDPGPAPAPAPASCADKCANDPNPAYCILKCNGLRPEPNPPAQAPQPPLERQ